MAEYHVFIVSDGTGETATRMSKAALAQFRPANITIERHGNIRSVEAIRALIKQAETRRALVIHTFASHRLRRAIEEACVKRNVPSHDLMGLLLEQLEHFIGSPPTEKPGLLHQVDNDYFEKMDALAFTVRNDDCRNPEDLASADIILIGASRTSKTPLSIYLAQEGWRVANVPLVPGEPLMPELEMADPKRVVGLVTSPERLAEVRKARLSRMSAGNSTYADLERVREELNHCRSVVTEHPGWTLVDMSGKSVEEAAAEILDGIFGRERKI